MSFYVKSSPFPISLLLCSDMLFYSSTGVWWSKAIKKSKYYLFTRDNIMRNWLSVRSTVASVLFGGKSLLLLLLCRDMKKRTEGEGTCLDLLVRKEWFISSQLKPNQYTLKFKLILTYDKLDDKIMYPLQISVKHTLNLWGRVKMELFLWWNTFYIQSSLPPSNMCYNKRNTISLSIMSSQR